MTMISVNLNTKMDRCVKGRRFRFLGGLVVAFFSSVACSDVIGTGQFPLGVDDPAASKTESGALSTYRWAVAAFELPNATTTTPALFQSVVFESGQLSDELQAAVRGGPPQWYTVNFFAGDFNDLPIDARTIPEASQNTSMGYQDAYSYVGLQTVRTASAQGIGMLRNYAPAQPLALQGHLYALTGYAELFLADLYCSGVPLSTLDFERDFTYRAGSTTQEVYRDAILQFNTALTLSVNDGRILNLARVGKGRAYLALARYDSAALAVADVPIDYQYSFATTLGDGSPYSVADREGETGLAFRSDADPRTAFAQNGTNRLGLPIYYPTKYNPTGSSTAVIANGVEARLIEAEAQLQPAASPSGPWLATLNTLRQTIGLADTTDPGTAEGRIDLLFRERAYWLFLTGHRQGDLRRLVRNYKRPQQMVYPTGPFGAVYATYGTDVTLPIPEREHVNPKFTGCLNREA